MKIAGNRGGHAGAVILGKLSHAPLNEPVVEGDRRHGRALGAPLSFGLARVMSSFLYRVDTADPIVYGGGAILMLVVTTLASLSPVRRAARVEPSIALRSE